VKWPGPEKRKQKERSPPKGKKMTEQERVAKENRGLALRGLEASRLGTKKKNLIGVRERSGWKQKKGQVKNTLLACPPQEVKRSRNITPEEGAHDRKGSGTIGEVGRLQ